MHCLASACFPAGLVATLLCACVVAAKGDKADMVLHNGRIVTVDDEFTIADAVAIRDGKFVAVGDSETVLRHAGPGTTTIDLAGKTVIPGLIEGHAHVFGAATAALHEQVPPLRSVEDVLAYVAEMVKHTPKGQLIRVPKAFPTRLREERLPTREELDGVAPDHPVLVDQSYAVMVNSRTLQLAGITNEEPPPSDTSIQRDARTGEPTGLVRGGSRRFAALAPKRRSVSFEEQVAALGDLLRRYNEVGITGIVSGGVGTEAARAYMELHRTGRLTARCNFTCRAGSADDVLEIVRTLDDRDLTTGLGDDMIRIGAAKVGIDGGILSGTAYLGTPYGPTGIFHITDPAYRGDLRSSQDELRATVRRAWEQGWQFTAHAVGDAAVDHLLDAYAQIHRESDLRPRRFQVIHADFVSPEGMRHCRDMGVVLQCQPAWHYKDGAALSRVLSREQLRRFMPLGSLFEAGIVVAGGSDHMIGLDPNDSVNPYNPWLGIWNAVTRRVERGDVLGPDERLTREQALRMYTINNAYMTFEDDIKGSIEVGKLADLAVLTDDILNCPEDAIKAIRAEMTILGGKIVHPQ